MSLNPKTPVVEIMQQYPETLEVFKAFGMRCAEDKVFANKSLEDNFIIEKVSFIELLNALNKVINPAVANNDHTSEKVDQRKPKDKKNCVKENVDIGEVQSHYTSLDEKFSWWVLFWLFLPFFGLLIVLCYTLWRFLRPNYLCVLGTKGFIVSRISKNNKKIRSSKSFLFTEMTDLQFRKTAKYINGVYSGTSYKFHIFRDRYNVFSKSGVYKENKKGIYGWKYSFLCGVEKNWTVYILQQFVFKLRTKGAVHFKAKDELIEIGTYYLKYKGVTFSCNEIKSYEFRNGMLFIEHINYESNLLGFKTKGDSVVIPINEMYNQKAFLILLNNLVS